MSFAAPSVSVSFLLIATDVKEVYRFISIAVRLVPLCMVIGAPIHRRFDSLQALRLVGC